MVDAKDVMKGFPPDDEAQVSLANWRVPPLNRWAFHRISQLMPCAMVWRGEETGTAWRRDLQPIDDIAFDLKGEKITVGEMLKRTFADGFIVLRDGALVHASYDDAAGLEPQIPHMLFSITKSVVSLVAGILVGQGSLDTGRPVSAYIPEVKGSAYDDATVEQLLDMTVAVDFTEDFVSSDSDTARYRAAIGRPVGSAEQPSGIRRTVPTVAKSGQHGAIFRYCSANTDLLGWILERVAGLPFADLLSQSLWIPMGAEDTAHMGVDAYGAARTAGALCTTTRDLARVGQLVLDRGAANGRQIVPEAWIDDLYHGGSREAWKGGTFEYIMPDAWYRSKWYKHGPDAHALSGFGLYGQILYVHPGSRMVFAKFSSQPAPLDADSENLQLRAFEAVAAQLG